MRSIGIVIICCSSKTISVVVDTSKPIILNSAEIKAEFDRMDNPIIEWQYPEKEEKHDRRAEKALFSFHGNKYRLASNYSKNIRRTLNRNLIRNRNDI